jgi:hypothetical protein
MRLGRLASLSMLALAAMPLPAAAQGSSSAQLPNPAGRYAMTPVEGGMLRMDTDTGVVSLCSRKSGSWACETLPDDTATLRAENERLARENRELREGRGLGPERRAERKFELPSEADVDKALSYLDRMMRKFREFIDKQAGQDRPGRQL